MVVGGGGSGGGGGGGGGGGWWWWEAHGGHGSPQRPIPAHRFWSSGRDILLHQHNQEHKSYACLGNRYLWKYSSYVFKVSPYFMNVTKVAAGSLHELWKDFWQ